MDSSSDDAKSSPKTQNPPGAPPSPHTPISHNAYNRKYDALSAKLTTVDILPPYISDTLPFHTPNIHNNVSLKFVFLGDSGVGKSNLISQLENQGFIGDYVPNTSSPRCSCTLQVDHLLSKHSIYASLWDTTAHPDYAKLRPLAYPNTSLFVICFSPSDPASFDNISKKWIPELFRTHDYAQVPFVIVATKMDLCPTPSKSFVDLEQAIQEISTNSAVAYFETSSKRACGLDILKCGLFRYALSLNFPPKPNLISTFLSRFSKSALSTPSAPSENPNPYNVPFNTFKYGPSIKEKTHLSQFRLSVYSISSDHRENPIDIEYSSPSSKNLDITAPQSDIYPSSTSVIDSKDKKT